MSRSRCCLNWIKFLCFFFLHKNLIKKIYICLRISSHRSINSCRWICERRKLLAVLSNSTWTLVVSMISDSSVRFFLFVSSVIRSTLNINSYRKKMINSDSSFSWNLFLFTLTFASSCRVYFIKAITSSSFCADSSSQASNAWWSHFICAVISSTNWFAR